MTASVRLTLLAVILSPVFSEIIRLTAPDGKYRLTSADQGRDVCESRGYLIASEADLRDAFDHDNYEICVCAWVEEGKSLLPMQKARDGCASTRGVHECPSDYKEWGNKGWDVFCKRDNSDVYCPTNVTVGPELAAFSGTSDDHAYLLTESAFPSDGYLTGWEFFAHSRGKPVYASVYRPEAEGYRAVTSTRVLPSSAESVSKHIFTFDEEVRVKKGDFIGYHFDTFNEGSPLAVADEENLCTKDGTCLNVEDLQDVTVVHRHHEQLFHVDNYLLKMNAEWQKKKMLPALRPVFCPNEDSGLPVAPTPEGLLVTEAGRTVLKPVAEDTACRFPFTYYGETFYACTKVNSNSRYWCSTTESYDGKNWRWCNDGDLYIEDIDCHFPFTYNGDTYNECTKEGSQIDTPWCSINPTYTRFGWRHCKENEYTTEPSTEPTTSAEVATESTAESTTTESSSSGGRAEPQSDDVACVFPFTYKGQAYHACTDYLSNEGLWCSTEAEYDGSHWRLCNEGDRQLKDMKCSFPFTYNGKEFNNCISANATRPWCSVIPEYDGINWRECTTEDEGAEKRECHYPFTYKGLEYNMCIKAGSVKYWCSTTAEYDQFTWRDCTDEDRVPSNMECHLPFTSGGEQHQTCALDGSERYWCAVEEEQNDINWRYCREGDTYPEEKPCHLPFNNKGESVSQCSNENAAKPWCSLTEMYDPNGEWRYCRRVELTPLPDEKTELLEEAAASCAAQNLNLATRLDARAAWEVGAETCGCGWVSDGTRVNLVHVGCDAEYGFHDCDGPSMPICIDDRI